MDGVSVSVIFTTGIPFARARSTRPWMSGVEFCELNTKTFTSLVVIWLWTVALSAALGSVPSLVAFR